MNRSRSDVFAPFLKFFASGRLAFGFLAMLMQVSLLLWPAASRWAKKAREREEIEKLLQELSETHRPALSAVTKIIYPEVAKKIQQPA